MSDIFVDEKGNMSPVEPKDKRAYSLEELQEKVCGLVLLIDIGKYYVVVNKDGGLRRMRLNSLATLWLEHAGINNGVVGPAMLIRKETLGNE